MREIGEMKKRRKLHNNKDLTIPASLRDKQMNTPPSRGGAKKRGVGEGGKGETGCRM